MPNKFREKYHGDALEKISNSKGGSLIEVDKATALNEPALVISLGGLGGLTLNALKKKYLEEVSRVTRKNIEFLAVDTSTAELDDIRTVNSSGEANPKGYIENDEWCNIITNVQAIAGLPTLMRSAAYQSPCKEWYDMNIPPVAITDNGAGGKRQIARLMLSDSNNWNHIYRKIDSKMASVIKAFAAAPSKLHVILIAGISGGTGSGTIVDISYMIRLAAKRFGVALSLEAIIFTPDVQFCTPADNVALQRSFGAAMKEINTFMYAVETHDKYRFSCPKFPNGIIDDGLGHSIDAPENIFESCTLIQGYDTNGRTYIDLNVPINTAANYVINLLTDTNITSNGVSEQVLTSVLANDIAITPGAVTNYINAADGRPVDVYYKYRTIGFSSVTFPIEAIMTLLANETVEALYRKFDVQPGQTAREVLSQGSIAIAPKTIGRNVFDELSEAHRKHAYDLILKTYISGSSCPTLTASQIRNQNGLNKLEKLANLGQFSITNANLNTNEAAIDHIITQIITKVDQEMRQHRGPYAALRLSQGICGIMRDMGTKTSAYYADTAAYFVDQKKRLKNELTQLCEKYKGKLVISRTALDEFNSYYAQYVRILTYEHSLNDAVSTISAIYDKYADKHNKVFEIYTGAFDAIMEILNTDSAAIAQTNRDVTDGTTTFSADLFNAKDLVNFNTNLGSIIGHYLNNQDRVDALADRLIDDILTYQDAWTATDNGFGGVDHIRKLFKEEFKTFVNEQVEKFAVVKYSDEAKLNQCMDDVIGQLDMIGKTDPATGARYTWADFENWYNGTFTPAGGKTPLDRAAEDIFNKVTGVGMLARVEDNGEPITPFGTDLQTSFNCYQLLCLMNSTPEINAKIQALPAYTALTANGNFRVGVGNTSQVYTIYVTCGVPLYILKGMKDVQKTYADCINHVNLPQNAGMHMDASPKAGWRFFPEIVPNSALYYLDTSTGKTAHTLTNEYSYEKDIEKKVLKNVMLLDEYGMIEYNGHPSPHFDMSVPLAGANSTALIDDVVKRFKAVYEAALGPVTPVPGELPKVSLKNQFEAISAQYTLKDVLDLGQITDQMGTVVEYRYDIKYLLTSAMPQLTNGIAGNMPRDAKLASIARAVRISSDWRNHAEMAVDEYKPIYEKVKAVKTEIEEAVMAKKMVVVSAAVHNEMLTLFIKAILLGMVKIAPEYVNGILISLQIVAATSDTNYKSYNTKGVEAFTMQYERTYYLYGVFSRFLFSIDENYNANWWQTFKTAVSAKYNNYAADGDRIREMMAVAKEVFVPDLSPLNGLAVWETDARKAEFENELGKSGIFPDFTKVVLNGSDTFTAAQIDAFCKNSEQILENLFGLGWRDFM